MGKVKLLLDVIGDLRSLADSLQAVADAAADNGTVEEMTATKEPGKAGKAGKAAAKNTAKKDPIFAPCTHIFQHLLLVGYINSPVNGCCMAYTMPWCVDALGAVNELLFHGSVSLSRGLYMESIFSVRSNLCGDHMVFLLYSKICSTSTLKPLESFRGE